MKTWRIAILALCGLGLSGCLEREMVITTQPEGALVIIGDEEKGRTPVTVPFTFYGDYDIILRRDGYETLKTHANLRAPAYEIPPIDLFSEMLPWNIKDTRYLNFELKKQAPVSDQTLIDKAQQLQKKNAETVLP